MSEWNEFKGKQGKKFCCKREKKSGVTVLGGVEWREYLFAYPLFREALS